VAAFDNSMNNYVLSCASILRDRRFT